MDEQRAVTLGEACTMLAIMHELDPTQVIGAVIFSVVMNCDDITEPHVHVLQVGLSDDQSLHAIDSGIGAIGD